MDDYHVEDVANSYAGLMGAHLMSSAFKYVFHLQPWGLGLFSLVYVLTGL